MTRKRPSRKAPGPEAPRGPRPAAGSRLLAAWLAAALLLASLRPLAAAEREGGPAAHDPAALALVAATVDSVRAAGRLPIVLFDIDGTLLDPAARHQAIFRRYAEEHPGEAAALRAGLERLPRSRYAYAPESTLARMGIADTALVRRVKREWVRHFFSNEYLDEDTPLPGATAYVNGLWERGAFIIYLTGRDLPRMLEGTAASLRDRGFPVARPRVSLVLKPDPGLGDAAFKGPALDGVAATGTVCGLFENEPGNLNLMAERFPEARAIFVDTNHSPGAPPVVARAAWIRSYEGP
jgi:beta-phosphoglucomutase-like phosphatase (HAD superfamily)